MRFRLASLPELLERALAAGLVAAGHEPAADAADALVVGLGPTLTPTRVLDLTHDDWGATVARARSAFVAMRRLAGELVAREDSGRIVVVTEPPAVRVVEGMVASAVPGAFVTTLAQVAAAELGSRAIAVNVLVAGWIEPAPARLADGVPLGRLAQADEIAAACAFLLSDQASYVTGATLMADGGYVITKAGGGNPLAPWLPIAGAGGG